MRLAGIQRSHLWFFNSLWPVAGPRKPVRSLPLTSVLPVDQTAVEPMGLHWLVLCSLLLRGVGDKHLSNEMVSISVIEVVVTSSKSWPGMPGKHVATEMKQSITVKHRGCYVATRNAVESRGINSRSCQLGCLGLCVSLFHTHER